MFVSFRWRCSGMLSLAFETENYKKTQIDVNQKCIRLCREAKICVTLRCQNIFPQLCGWNCCRSDRKMRDLKQIFQLRCGKLKKEKFTRTSIFRGSQNQRRDVAFLELRSSTQNCISKWRNRFNLFLYLDNAVVKVVNLQTHCLCLLQKTFETNKNFSIFFSKWACKLDGLSRKQKLNGQNLRWWQSRKKWASLGQTCTRSLIAFLSTLFLIPISNFPAFETLIYLKFMKNQLFQSNFSVMSQENFLLSPSHWTRSFLLKLLFQSISLDCFGQKTSN